MGTETRKEAEMTIRAVDINVILKEIGNGIYVEYQSILKNGCLMDAYEIKKEGARVSPVLYFDRGWWCQSDRQVAEYVKDIFYNHSFDVEMMDVNLMDKSYVLSHILPRMVSAEKCPYLDQEGRAYDTYLDLAVVYYIPVCGSGEDTLSSIHVSDILVTELGIRDEIRDAAVSNLERQSKTILMDDFLRSLKKDIEPGIPMVIGTNTLQINGASVILSGKVLDEMRERLNAEKIVVLPSSIHEVIAVEYHAETSVSFLKEVVEHANNTIVSMEDQLSDSVYLWDGGSLEKLA